LQIAPQNASAEPRRSGSALGGFLGDFEPVRSFKIFRVEVENSRIRVATGVAVDLEFEEVKAKRIETPYPRKPNRANAKRALLGGRGQDSREDRFASILLRLAGIWNKEVRMRYAMLFVLFSAACMAQEPIKPSDPDKAGLPGEWVASRVEALREEMKDSKQIRITVEGDKLVMSGGGEKKESYTFRLDSSKTPKVIDLYQGGKLISRRIYALEKDELRLCFGLAHYKGTLASDTKREFVSAGDRPTEFDSRQGVLFILQRCKGK
jgi:uncharacterized protein (TIGR03067 family)